MSGFLLYKWNTSGGVPEVWGYEMDRVINYK